MAVLKIEELTHKYNDQIVLNNVNIEIEKNKSYAIVGKSGSGKTTLLSLISGLENCEIGKISFGDEILTKANADKYRAENIGVVFQSYNLINTYTIHDNLEVAMRIANKEYSKEKIIDILKKVDLDPAFLDKTPLQLSGGQQQRVAIARAILADADLIIADEPTGNLDEETETEIIALLCNLVKNENKTLIIVTHSNYVASTMDHIYGINQGRVNIIK